MKLVLKSLFAVCGLAFGSAVASADSASAQGCEGVIDPYDVAAFPWGEEVDVAGLDDVKFFLPTTQDAEAFTVGVESFGGFECEVTKKKVAPGCMSVVVSWFPGADSSGCTLTLSDGTATTYAPSMLFMSY